MNWSDYVSEADDGTARSIIPWAKAQEMQHNHEDHQSAMEVLDELGVPRTATHGLGSIELSLVGRIYWAVANLDRDAVLAYKPDALAED